MNPIVKCWTPDELGNLLVTLADKRGTKTQITADETSLYTWKRTPVLCNKVVVEPCGSREIVKVWAVADKQTGKLVEVSEGQTVK